ncbi:hypothetical protein CH92_10100 [Stutzerimonas stutzeri]|uniref:Uncharacterized protein n=1 Tax=Stutzerimonas stutzeri TaxID=316 RepID=W8RAJ9_STUST|nr:hypothetical protein [Stutzerimonas stutzeri]AHL75442.1 hypothetical protein CH92_10100 [Stutzerimonas stutzeri]MCQ4327995.1 hypothetical protein [Stutzerimonas stutzeri]
MKKPELYEVWGDTVDSGHLIIAIIIGACISLGTFYLAQHLLLGIVESAQMARAYAMLTGILGCLAGGVISAILFKPKRDVVENMADPTFRQQVLAELTAEHGTLGRLDELPAEVVAELRELALYDLFRDAEAAEARTAPGATSSVEMLPAQASLNGGRA